MKTRLVSLFDKRFESIDKTTIVKVRHMLPECVELCDKVLNKLDQPTASDSQPIAATLAASTTNDI